jgi:hypothetical protein
VSYLSILLSSLFSTRSYAHGFRAPFANVLSSFSLQTPRSSKEVEPFVPQRSSRPLTEISDVQLNSDIRAAKRQVFEKEKAEKEAAAQAALAILRQQQLEQEEREIKEMRKQMVVKARPVPNYHFFEPKPSLAPLTQPASPQLLTKRRQAHHPPSQLSQAQSQSHAVSVGRRAPPTQRSGLRDL